MSILKEGKCQDCGESSCHMNYSDEGLFCYPCLLKDTLEEKRQRTNKELREELIKAYELIVELTNQPSEENKL